MSVAIRLTSCDITTVIRQPLDAADTVVTRINATHYSHILQQYAVTEVWLGLLVFNGTFSTNRLQIYIV